jgi:hypothetical protein
MLSKSASGRHQDSGAYTPFLNEKQYRLQLAVEAMSYGWGRSEQNSRTVWS